MKILTQLFFAFNYIFGWVLEYFSLPYRPFYSAIFLSPYLLIKRIKFFTLIAILLFTAVILISAYINRINIFNTLTYFRYVFLAILVIGLSETNLFEKMNAKTSWFHVFIVVQIIFLIFQLIFADFISQNTSVSLIVNDVRTGTFRLKGDPVLSAFFIALIFLFLQSTGKDRQGWIFYFVLPLLGVFLANSTLSKLLVLLILGLNFIKINVKLIVAAALIGLIIITQTNIYDDFVVPVQSAYEQFSELDVSKDQMQRFMEGGYGRVAAIIYYANYWTWWGNGPGSSFDVVNREYNRGNTGQIFLFLDEIGLFGLIISFLFLFGLCLQIGNNRMEQLSVFLLLSALSITSFPFSDIGLWFILLFVRDFFNAVKTEQTTVVE